MLGICCRPPDQGKEVDEAFFKQFQEVSVSHASGCHRKIFSL